MLHYKRERDTNRPSHSHSCCEFACSFQALPSFNHARKHKRAHSTDGLKLPPFLSLKVFRPNCSTDHECHIHPSSSSSFSPPRLSFSLDVCDYLCRIDQMFFLAFDITCIICVLGITWLTSPLFLCLFFSVCHFSVCRDLSENQIQAIPRKAFRGITSVKNL